jgi:hypothetical protein
MTNEQPDHPFDPLDFGIVLLAEALHVLEEAEHPLVSSYVQLALDLAQAEAGKRASELAAVRG